MIGWLRGKNSTKPRGVDRAADLAGQRRAYFERLMQENALALYGAARRMARNPEDAEDLAQDTLLDAYKAFDSFTPGTNFRAWLLRILTNNYIEDYRRRRLLSFLAWDDLGKIFPAGPDSLSGGAQQEPEPVLFASALNEEIEMALGRLSEPMRLTLLLVDVEQLSYEEAAAALQLPVGTIRSRLNRGREQLRSCLQEYARQNNLI